MGAYFSVDVELTLPVERVEGVLADLRGRGYEVPEPGVGDLAAALSGLFEYDELEYVEAGGRLSIEGNGWGSMPYSVLLDLGDALTPFAEGVIDFTTDDVDPTRWRFRDGMRVAHAGEVVYPTDVAR